MASADGQPLDAAESGAEALIPGSLNASARPGAGDLLALGETDGGVAPLASPLASPQAYLGSSNWIWAPITPSHGEGDSGVVDGADDPLALDRMPPGDTASSADTCLLVQDSLPQY